MIASERVLFNASVILAGLKSPKGGSAKLLSFCKKGTLVGKISEIILEEILRNAPRIGFDEETIIQKISKIFPRITSPPGKALVDKYKTISLDLGDAHVLASAKEENADFLVTLDKKHLLVLKNKIKEFEIVSPGELIEILKKLAPGLDKS